MFSGQKLCVRSIQIPLALLAPNDGDDTLWDVHTSLASPTWRLLSPSHRRLLQRSRHPGITHTRGQTDLAGTCPPWQEGPGSLPTGPVPGSLLTAQCRQPLNVCTLSIRYHS